MKQVVVSKEKSVALALAWDGTRWPVRSLPVKARAFLAATNQSKTIPSAKAMAKSLSSDAITEIRICWVPQLKGGEDVLSGPFTTRTGKRIGFRIVRTARFGDVLGVVYRKS